MQAWLFSISFALAAGGSLVLQQAVNANLRTALQSTAWAGFASYLVGLICMTIAVVALREAVHGYVMAAVPALPDWPGTARRLRAEHRDVVRAVRAGEAGRAATAVRAHIEGFTAEAGLVAAP